MSAIAESKLYTFEDFCTIVADGQKADLIDGVIYMASPDNTDANDLFGWLYSVMRDFATIKRLGKVYGSRVAFRLGKRNGPEPDIGFVALKRLHRIMRGFVQGPPDLAVEIISPDSIERDYVKKRAQYERAGVKEYWIVDELREEIVLLRLGADGKFHHVRAVRGILRSTVLTGFWVNTEWFWQKPLPTMTETLQKILAVKK